MPFDPHKNFVYSLVAVAPSPATSGTSLTVSTGDGALFPDPASLGAYNVVIASAAGAGGEVARVTAKAGDVLTLTRNQESSGARTVVVGDTVFMAITAKALTDIETGGLLTNASIAAAAGIASSKLAIGVTTAYTPTWTSTGVAPALGNGSLVGSYVQIGKLVVASLTLTCGTTTTYGTGAYSFSVPVSPAVVGNMAGSGIVQNTGGANASLVNWRTSGDVALNQLAFAQMTPTAPITLASGSSLNMTLAYIAA